MPLLKSILIVDDDRSVLLRLRRLLESHAENVQTLHDPSRVPELVRNETFDAILLDMNFTPGEASGREGLAVLGEILAIDPDAVVVPISAYANVDSAVLAMKEGATDFVTKPWQNEQLIATLNTAVRLGRSRRSEERLKSRLAAMEPPFEDLLGCSRAMKEVFERGAKVAPSNAGILIVGENGTGKTVLARDIHRKSSRADGPFVAVNVGALTESLFESAMFGHVRGAFTDAKESRAGHFEAASGGTLFLDEIGDLPLHMQGKLLTAIDSKEVTRVGSIKPVRFDVRLIFATNKNLEELVDQKKLRDDLYFRIYGVRIYVPALRERADDIPALARHFLGFYARLNGKPRLTISDAAMAILVGYAWPGNVRELRNAIESAVVEATSDALQPHDFPKAAASTMPAGQRFVFPVRNLVTVERAVILEAMRAHKGNITAAAQDLGLTRQALYRRLERHGLLNIVWETPEDPPPAVADAAGS